MPFEKSIIFRKVFDAWIGDEDLQIDILRLIESYVFKVQEVNNRILALDDFLYQAIWSSFVLNHDISLGHVHLFLA